MTILSPINASASPEVQMNDHAETLSAAGIFGKRQSATSGLIWGYYGGVYNGNTKPDGTVTQTDNATNYIVLLRSTAVVSVSASSANSLDPLYAKLYMNTVAGGVVTASADQRMDANGLLIGGAGAAGGSVTSVDITAPAAGITATGGPVTTTGSITIALANDLGAVEGLATTGIVRRTAADTWSAGTAVSLTTEVSGILPIANIATGTPDGSKFVRDDGTLAIPSTTGGTVTSVNITQPAAGITATGGPITTTGAITLALANDLGAVEGLATTGIVRRTAADTWSAGGAVDLATEVSGTLPAASVGGAITAAGFTMATARLLGRTTAATGAVEEISVGTGLSLSAGALSATGGSGSGIPVNSQSANYTMVIGDANGGIYHPAADTTARTWTIPANASVAFPNGTAITFDNDFGAGALTIAITSDQMILVGNAGSSGSRTLATGGQATAWKVTATRWRINGTGLT